MRKQRSEDCRCLAKMAGRGVESVDATAGPRAVDDASPKLRNRRWSPPRWRHHGYESHYSLATLLSDERARCRWVLTPPRRITAPPSGLRLRGSSARRGKCHPGAASRARAAALLRPPQLSRRGLDRRAGVRSPHRPCGLPRYQTSGCAPLPRQRTGETRRPPKSFPAKWRAAGARISGVGGPGRTPDATTATTPAGAGHAGPPPQRGWPARRR